MTKQLTAWIDGKTSEGAADAGFDLVSPIDGATLYRIVENDDATIDAAVQSAHRAYLANRRSTIAQRVAWLAAQVRRAAREPIAWQRPARAHVVIPDAVTGDAVRNPPRRS